MVLFERYPITTIFMFYTFSNSNSNKSENWIKAALMQNWMLHSGVLVFLLNFINQFLLHVA